MRNLGLNHVIQYFFCPEIKILQIIKSEGFKNPNKFIKSASFFLLAYPLNFGIKAYRKLFEWID